MADWSCIELGTLVEEYKATAFEEALFSLNKPLNSYQVNFFLEFVQFFQIYFSSFISFSIFFVGFDQLKTKSLKILPVLRV